jgi:hypothetical protein
MLQRQVAHDLQFFSSQQQLSLRKFLMQPHAAREITTMRTMPTRIVTVFIFFRIV